MKAYLAHLSEYSKPHIYEDDSSASISKKRRKFGKDFKTHRAEDASFDTMGCARNYGPMLVLTYL